MSKKIQAIRGMNDLLPSESNLWLALEETINQLLISYGYKYCRVHLSLKILKLSRAQLEK